MTVVVEVVTILWVIILRPPWYGVGPSGLEWGFTE